MSDGDLNSPFLKRGNALQHALHLRGDSDIADVAAGRFLVCADQIRISLLKQMLRHSAIVIRGQKRPFSMAAMAVS